MFLQSTDSIPTMVSRVVDNQVEIVGQEGPEWVVEINRQAIAVAQGQAAVPPDFHGGAG